MFDLESGSATLVDCFLSLTRLEYSVLCDQIQKYRSKQDLFDLDNSFAKDNPINWWKDIDTAPEPIVLSKVACNLLQFVLIQQLVNVDF